MAQSRSNVGRPTASEVRAGVVTRLLGSGSMARGRIVVFESPRTVGEDIARRCCSLGLNEEGVLFTKWVIVGGFRYEVE